MLLTWFGSLQWKGNNIKLIDEFMEKEIVIEMEENVVDVGNTHNFLCIVTQEYLYITRIDDIKSSLRWNRDDKEFNFKPFSLCFSEKEYTKRGVLDLSLMNNHCVHTIIAATSKTIYYIRTMDNNSSIIRLFHETEYFDKEKIDPKIVQNTTTSENIIIQQVASGYDHVLCLTSDGNVLTFGNGSHGELGTGEAMRSDEVLAVEDLAGLAVKRIDADAWHSVALTESNDVYVWGWNQKGEVGKDLPDCIYSPYPLDIDGLVSNIQTFSNATIIWIDEATVPIVFGRFDSTI